MYKTKSFSVLILSAFLLGQSLYAQETPQTHSIYFGVSAGVPFGFSTYSSFGGDGLRIGATGGIFTGYRLSRNLSVEADMGWGYASMSPRTCCSNYWIGEDWHTYYGAVLGMNGWDREGTRSDIFLQKYGARFNADILGPFKAEKDSRWHLEVSPQLYLYGSKSSLLPKSGTQKLLNAQQNWHFGYGASIQAGYDITDNLRLAIDCGLTRLTGHNIDGLTGRGMHKSNCVMETTLRLSWDIPTGHKTKVTKANTPSGCIQSTPAKAIRETVQMPEQIEETRPTAEEQTTSPNTDTTTVTVLPDDVNIFFDKSSWTIESDQEDKLAQAALYLIMNKEVTIKVNGWCDKYGTDEVNAVISDLRARAVKNWLVYAGVDTDRITTEGYGVDRDETDRSFARRSSIIFETSEQNHDE